MDAGDPEHGGGAVPGQAIGVRARPPAARMGIEDRALELEAFDRRALECQKIEVGEEVARDVSAATGSRPLRCPDWERPHLDLIDATRLALEGCGVQAVDSVSACTRCDSDLLFSYRRDGAGAGRNVALIWRSSDD